MTYRKDIDISILPLKGEKPMDRTEMNETINASRNALENIYRAAYEAGRRDADRECGERYTVNVLNYLKAVLIDEAMGRHEDNTGLWIAIREIDDTKDYIMAGGKFDSWNIEALRRRR